MNVDYETLVQSTRRLFEGFPELRNKLNELVEREEPPLVYTAMTLLARAMIDDMRAESTSRLSPLLHTVELILLDGQFDVRNLIISGLLEDLWNLSVQAGIEPLEWERRLDRASLVGWRAVLDYWQGRITAQGYNSILNGD